MSFKDKRERGSAFACYSDEYNDIPWGYAHVGIQLKRAFPKDRLEHGLCIERTLDGDVKAYDAAAREEQHKVEELKEQCEQHFPILKKMDFAYGFLGESLIWTVNMLTDKQRLLLYKEFRNQAWSMWQDIPQLVKASKLDFKDYTVEPLPGPWRYRFL